MSSNIGRPFNLDKLDFEAIRKRRRKRIIFLSLPVTILMFLFSLWLVLPFFVTKQADSRLKSYQPSISRQWLVLLGTNDVFERYKLPFNKAIVATHEKQFDSADAMFELSETLAPPQELCFIRAQRVLSNELAGDHAINEKDLAKAMTAYLKAFSIVQKHPACFDDDGGKKLSQRILVKIAALVEKLKNPEYKDDDEAKDEDNKKPDPTVEPDEKQIDKLKQIEKESQRRRDDAKHNEGSSGRQDCSATKKVRENRCW